ncbi:hypothetical protein [Oryzomonas rubra]|uniref:hypothetical protein n=1 Tax=Oryzomonas rubra TaxID=2509454 RepID=UPI00165EA1BC|nr:hypothetical protein [Oryzomonas rubra]
MDNAITRTARADERQTLYILSGICFVAGLANAISCNAAGFVVGIFGGILAFAAAKMR